MIPPLLAVAKPRFQLFSQMGEFLYDLELLVPVTETQFQSKLIATESFRVSLILGGSRGSNHANKDSLSLSSPLPLLPYLCILIFSWLCFSLYWFYSQEGFSQVEQDGLQQLWIYILSSEYPVERQLIFPRVPGKVLVLRFIGQAWIM